jgi:hypothetical protein
MSLLLFEVSTMLSLVLLAAAAKEGTDHHIFDLGPSYNDLSSFSDIITIGFVVAVFTARFSTALGGYVEGRFGLVVLWLVYDSFPPPNPPHMQRVNLKYEWLSIVGAELLNGGCTQCQLSDLALLMLMISMALPMLLLVSSMLLWLLSNPYAAVFSRF